MGSSIYGWLTFEIVCLLSKFICICIFFYNRQYWKQQPKLALGIDALSIWNCSAGVTFLASILQDHDAAYPDI